MQFPLLFFTEPSASEESVWRQSRSILQPETSISELFFSTGKNPQPSITLQDERSRHDIFQNNFQRPPPNNRPQFPNTSLQQVSNRFICIPHDEKQHLSSTLEQLPTTSSEWPSAIPKSASFSSPGSDHILATSPRSEQPSTAVSNVKQPGKP